ncbi:MAG: proline dehydrogenase family protein [Methanosarcinales archaeon]|nr:proline dehydrogenase family protein [Methanosarcinales archaeon]
MGILIHFAKRWVAGEYLEDAVERARSANSRRIRSIINHVGEHNEDIELIGASAVEYSRLLDAVKSEQLDSSISVKPTQLGLMKDTQTCISTLEPLVRKASDSGILIWIDMEGSPYTQAIIDIYKHLFSSHKNLGIAIQAYLFRTPDDLKELSAIGGNIRLCKGAYNESAEIIIKNHDKVTEAFASQMESLFKNGGPGLIAIATHDSSLIELAKELNKTYPRNFEYQMLMGVRDKLKESLIREGYRVSGYIPYGKGWLAYFLRRLNEQKRDIKTGFISLFKQD